MIPTQPPCCHTLHLSHWMKRPPASSDSISNGTEEGFGPISSLTPGLAPGRPGDGTGGPGYSCCPQRHRVISSSSPSSSSSSTWRVFGISSSSSSRPRFRWRVCGSSPREDKSWSSRDCDRWIDDLGGEETLLFERVFRSARLSEFKDVEEGVCCGAAGGGWVVRAREDRRGLMTVACILLSNEF